MSCLNPTHDTAQAAQRPIAALAVSSPAGKPCELHSHPRAQLLYAISGTMTVSTIDTSWVVPPQRAVWIPPGVVHQAAARSPLEIRTLYIERSAIPKAAPLRPRILRVSPLLRELVSRVTTLPMEYDEQGRDGRLVQMLLEELDWTPLGTYSLPLLVDPRLLRLQHQLMENPGSVRTLNEWATIVGAAPRTLTRLLLKESGMSFRLWRENLRVFWALPSLMDGTPVTALSLNLGYESPSAFSSMFRRVMGVNPSEYVTSTSAD